jgi:integrase
MPSKLTKRSVAELKPKLKPYDQRDAECRGFLVRVEPSARKTFWFAFSAHKFGGKRGQRVYLGDFDSRSVESVRKDAQAAKAKVAQGIDPRAEKKAEQVKAAADRVSTLRVYLKEKFEPHALIHMKSGTEQLKRIRSDFKAHLDKPLKAFTPDLIKDMQADWVKAGLAKRTVNRDLQRISSVLSQAVEDKVIAHHPLKGGSVKPLKYDKRKVPRFLKPDEEKALRVALIKREQRLSAERASFLDNKTIAKSRKTLPRLDGEYHDYLRVMVLLALNCGLRRGELFSLRWADVDLTAKMITVEGESNDDGDGSKSTQSRPLPLNTEALTVVKAWRKRNANAEGLVFPSDDGKRFNNVNKSWSAIRKAAGLKKLNFHHLRHTFASKLVQRAVDLNTVRELMGHADISTTMIYAFLAPGNLQAAVAKLNQAAA